MKKIFAVLALLLVIGAASAYALFAPAWKEQGRTAVAAFLNDMPGECSAGVIDVEIPTGDIILKDLRWRVPAQQGQAFELLAEKVVLEGVDFEDLHRPGRARLARYVSVSGLRTVFPGALQQGAEPAGESMRLADLRLRGVSGDAALLLRGLRAENPGADLRIALMSFSVDSLTAEGYEKWARLPEGSVMFCGVKKAEIKDMRPLSMGVAVWEGVTLVQEGKGRLSLARLSLDEFAVPDFLEPLASRETTAELNFLSGLLASLEKDKLVLGNMEVSDLLLERADGEKLAAASFFLDLEGDTQEARLTQRGRGISVSAGFYQGRGDALAHFLRVWGKDLHLESRLDFSLRQTGLQGELMLRDAFLEDKELGSLRLEGVFVFDAEGETEPFDTGVALSLKRAEVLFKDRQILSVYLRSALADGEQAEAGRVELLRGHMADAFERDVNRAGGPGEAALFRGLAQLARAPGSLHLVFEPSGPVPLEPLFRNAAPELLEELNISAGYSPAERE